MKVKPIDFLPLLLINLKPSFSRGAQNFNLAQKL